MPSHTFLPSAGLQASQTTTLDAIVLTTKAAGFSSQSWQVGTSSHSAAGSIAGKLKTLRRGIVILSSRVRKSDQVSGSITLLSEDLFCQRSGKEKPPHYEVVELFVTQRIAR
jgi:hypothetical protein